MKTTWLVSLLAAPAVAWTVFQHGSDGGGASPEMTGTFLGVAALVVFILAYSLVPFEHNIHLRKSKPVLLAAGIIWIFAAIAYARIGDTQTAHDAIRHSLLEYGELFLFLLAAMTYINSLEERNVFETLRAWLVSRGFTLRQVFWITGVLAFFISPIADNLTTALLMGAVVMAVGGSNRKFVVIACVNIVVAANAGGAFSPFGDITTLMVWQKDKVQFFEFLAIFLPSVVNWLIPAFFMSAAVGKEQPEQLDEQVTMKYGAKVMIALFLVTIATAVTFHSVLHLPPAAGMMFGLGMLGFWSYHIKRHEGRDLSYDGVLGQTETMGLAPIFVPDEEDPSVANVVDECSDPALAIDADHRVTHWNAAMEELTGVKAEDMIGRKDSWRPFYDSERPILADLIVDECGEDQYQAHYPGKFRRSSDVQATEAADYKPHLGGGKMLAFSAAPVRDAENRVVGAVEVVREVEDLREEAAHFDLMQRIARAEWDTLLFFYGVILCVGGLAQFGYLATLSEFMYTDLGPTAANSAVGVLSAIIDNIPVMFAVLTMDPDMTHNQWLLVTLTAGVGGSMLAIGSAAGVALMGTARGLYTFGAHLRWTPVIALGYVAAILVHLLLNGSD